MRLLYLDEAGTDRVNAPVLCVAGVLVHGDYEYPEVERRMAALVEKYVPEPERAGFIFHATDIYHGAGKFFDRRKPEWAERAKREAVLLDLAKIIEDLALPVVVGRYHKDIFGLGYFDDDEAKREALIHMTAAFDCLVHAERWLSRFAPSELARVTHEDGPRAKATMKGALRALRHPDFLAWSELPQSFVIEFGLPLKRIVDSVSFEDKRDARPLQLADLCAFIFGRITKNAPVPEDVADILLRHAKWMMKLSEEAKARASSPQAESPP